MKAEVQTFIDNEHTTIDGLTREEAYRLRIAAQELSNQLARQYELPSWLDGCIACHLPITDAWFHGNGRICKHCGDEMRERGEDRDEFVDRKRKEIRDRNPPLKDT